MQRFASRPIRLLIGLFLISISVSGCFQTAGASLEATPTGNAPAVPPATQTQVQAVEPPTLEPTLDTGVQPTAVFEQPTAIPTDVLFEQPTAIPTDVPFEQPTQAPLVVAEQPTMTPFEIAQNPTANPGDIFGGGPQATQTAVQATLFAQATQIIATVTSAAALDQTATSVALGTPMAGGENPGIAATATPLPGVQPGLPAANQTPQGTPGAPGSGAAGPVTGDCIYTVVDGDRIFRIALRFGMTPESLSRANGIVNLDLIVPGQKLRIPNCNGTPAPTMTATLGVGGAFTATPGAVSSASGRTYIVQEGDTLYAIATRYGVRVSALAQTNNITNINLIYIGQSLIIP